jgi:hypothetical protein
LSGTDHPFVLPRGWVIQQLLTVIITVPMFKKPSLHFYKQFIRQLTQGDFSRFLLETWFDFLDLIVFR